MWMMGCNDGGDQDSFNGRKLRPFVPSAARNHATDHFLALNHHFVMAEQNKKEHTTQQVVVSSRWNPTPEQLQTLEELYHRGVRTPSADQIQHITAQLRRYGKIEGKNVFYWFQNHKARERQKRRRQLDQEPCDANRIHDVERKKHSSAGENGAVFEVEQTYNKKLASPKKSNTTIAEKSMGAEGNKADGWVQFNGRTGVEEERKNPSNWQMLHLSSSNFPSPNNLINSSISATIPLKHRPFRSPGGSGVPEQTTTLQLFPVWSGGEEDQPILSHANYTNADHVTPLYHNYQFFEFLPLKN